MSLPPAAGAARTPPDHRGRPSRSSRTCCCCSGIAKDAMFHMPQAPGEPGGFAGRLRTARSCRGFADGPQPTCRSWPGSQVPKLPPAPRPSCRKKQREAGEGPGRLARSHQRSGAGQAHQVPVRARQQGGEGDPRAARPAPSTRTRSPSCRRKAARTRREQGAPAVERDSPATTARAGGGREQKRPEAGGRAAPQGRRDPLHMEARCRTAPSATASTATPSRATGNKIGDRRSRQQRQHLQRGARSAGRSAGNAGRLQRPLKLTWSSPSARPVPSTGGPMPDDLRGIEEGEGTFLQRAQVQVRGFLNRVKETVARVWTQKVHRRRRASAIPPGSSIRTRTAAP